jgi:hypothetical protein
MKIAELRRGIRAAGIGWLLGRGANLHVREDRVPTVSIESVRAAAAVLLQLEMMVDSASITDASGCRLNAAHETLSHDECAVRLASMPKPVRCYGGASDGVLTVDCQLIDPTVLRHTAPLFIRELSEEYGGITGRSRLLIAGRHEHLLLTAEEAAEMFRDYEVFFASRRLRAPDRAERADGATAVLSVHASHAGPMKITIQIDTAG